MNLSQYFMSNKSYFVNAVVLLGASFGMVFPSSIAVLGEERPGNDDNGDRTHSNSNSDFDLDLAPEIIEESPVLEEWSEEVPNVLEDIQTDPSFRSRVRFGYSHFPSTDHQGGWNVSVEDVFLGDTGFTLRGEYQGTFEGDRTTWGADLQYYALPLGSYVNIAPVVGYRHITTQGNNQNYETEGVNVGAKLLLALSRTGAADISLSQTFVSPGSPDEVGITTLSFGYAITSALRLSTDLQKQNSRVEKDSRVGLSLEWMW